MPFNLHRNGRQSGDHQCRTVAGPTGQSQDGFNRTAAALASRGYIVLQPNVRGVDRLTRIGNSRQPIFRNLGGGDLKDVLAAKGFPRSHRLCRSGQGRDPHCGSYGGVHDTDGRPPRPPKPLPRGWAAVRYHQLRNTMYENADPLLKEYIVSLLGRPPASYPAGHMTRRRP